MRKYSILILAILASFHIFGQMNSLPLVSTMGTATVYVEPNEALISFSVITSDNDILKAKQKNAEISKKTIAFLEKEGVDKKHIQTQYLNVGLNYRYERNPHGEQKYQASQSLSVCVTDLENLEQIMTGLLGLEIANLGSPVFRSSQLETYKDEARKKALKNAKHKAQLMTKELGQSIGRVHSISEVNQNGNNFRIAYADSAEAMTGNSGGDSFALGQLEITAQISVSFLIK